MVKRHPRVKVVIDHVGRVDLEAKDPEPEIRNLLALARYPNVWVKVSEFSSLLPSKKYPFRDAYPVVKRVYDAFGPDRLLWGTGFPALPAARPIGRPCRKSWRSFRKRSRSSPPKIARKSSARTRRSYGDFGDRLCRGLIRSAA